MQDVTLSLRLEGLNHLEFDVRSEILGMFKYEPVAEATERVVREIDQRGWDGAYEFSYQLTYLPHTEKSFAWLLERIQNRSLDGDADPRHVAPSTHLLNWFAKAPVDWIAPRLEDFCAAADDAAPSESSRFAQHDISGLNKARLRVEFAGLEQDELLKMLEQSWAQCLEGNDFPHAAVARLELICEALSSSEQPPQETLEQWLDIDCGVDIDWDRDSDYFRAGAALILMKQRGAVPPVAKVLRLFDLDWDWWNELIAETLAASPSKETLQELLSAFPSLEWHGKLFVSGAFEYLRFPGWMSRSPDSPRQNRRMITAFTSPRPPCSTERRRLEPPAPKSPPNFPTIPSAARSTTTFAATISCWVKTKRPPVSG
jgi:hypothetical protein